MAPMSAGNANFAANHMKQQRHNALPGGKPAITASLEGRNHFEVKCKKVHLLNAGRDSDECDEQWLAVVGADHKRVQCNCLDAS